MEQNRSEMPLKLIFTTFPQEMEIRAGKHENGQSDSGVR